MQLKTPVNRVSQSLTSLIALLLGDGGCHHWLLFNSAPSQPGFKYKLLFFFKLILVETVTLSRLERLYPYSIFL